MSIIGPHPDLADPVLGTGAVIRARASESTGRYFIGIILQSHTILTLYLYINILLYKYSYFFETIIICTIIYRKEHIISYILTYY